MTDEWSLKGKADYPRIKHTEDELQYKEKHIDILRQKLIEDIKEELREELADDETYIHAEQFDDWFRDIKDIINKRFGVEK